MSLGNCCCPESCYIIGPDNKLKYFSDFFEVFYPTGNYEVATSAPETKWHDIWTAWEGVQYDTCDLTQPICDPDDDECEGNHGADSNYIVFQGSGSLSLIYPDAIFTGSNFSISLPSTVEPNLNYPPYDNTVNYSYTLQETTEFTAGTGGNKHTVTVNRTTTNNGVKLTVNIDGTIAYTSDSPNGITTIGTHYLIRRGGKIFYYCNKSGTTAGVCYLGDFDDVPDSPIQFTYSWQTSDNRIVRIFDPQAVTIAKPQDWWKTGDYKSYEGVIDLSNLSLSKAKQYKQDYEEVLEAESNAECGFIGSSNDVVDTISFRALSPAISVQVSGFKNSTTNIPGKMLQAEYTDTNGLTRYELDSVLNNIDGSNINGFDPDFVDITPIGTSIAASWENAYPSFKIMWRNGARVTMNYSNMARWGMRAIQGIERHVESDSMGSVDSIPDTIYFQDSPPTTIMTNSEGYYSGNTYPGAYGDSGYQIDCGGCFRSTCGVDTFTVGTGEFDENMVEIRQRIVRYHGVLAVPNFKNNRHSPFGYLNEDNTPEQTEFQVTNLYLTVEKGIVATPQIAQIPKTLNTTAQFTISLPNLVSLSITSSAPKYGTATVSGSGNSYTILYTYNNATNVLFDRFEYQVTDKYGAKSKSTITVNFGGNSSTVIPYSNISESNTSCSDYELVCKFHFNVTAGLTKEINENDEYEWEIAYNVPITLYYIHPGRRLSASDLIGKTAEYRSDLDPIDALGNRIPQWISIDKTIQDTLVANFITVGEQTCPLATDRNMFLPDVGGSVTSVVAHLAIYTNESNPYATPPINRTYQVEGASTATVICWPTVSPGCLCNNTDYDSEAAISDGCVSVVKYDGVTSGASAELNTGSGYIGSFTHEYTDIDGTHTVTKTIEIPSYVYDLDPSLYEYDSSDPVWDYSSQQLSSVTWGNSTLTEFFYIEGFTVNYDNGEQKSVSLLNNGENTGHTIT